MAEGGRKNENMKTELEGRTLEFAVRIVAFIDSLPKTTTGWIIGGQLAKAGTSIGANYREAGRAESKNDFIQKVGIAEKESAETEYWLLICQRAYAGLTDVDSLIDESRQLLAIFTTIGRNARRNTERER
jgi:four helix bundle protein